MSLEGPDPGTAAGDLTVGGLLRATYATIAARPFGDLVAIVGIWTAVLIVGQVLILLGEVGNLPAAGEVEGGAQQMVRPLSAVIADLIFSMVNVIAFVDISVRWIRYLVLDEAPQGFLDPRLNARRWQFFLRWLVVVGCLVAAMVVVAMPIMALANVFDAGLLMIVLLTWAVFVYLSAGRLGLYLAGAALGDRRMTLAMSWRATRQVGGRLTLAVLAATLGFILPYLILFGLFPVVASVSISLAVVLITPAMVVLSIAMYLVYQAIIALAYTRLVPEPAPGTLIL